MTTLVCQPCQNDDVSVEAAGYCVDCAEYLCVTCYKFHCKPQPCRHHVLLDRESMPQQPAQHVQTETCVKHKGKVLEYFCNNHDYIGCSVCMTLEHTTCEGKNYIPDIATSIPESDEYKGLLSSINGLMSSADEQIKCLKHSLNDTQKFRDSVIADIICFRQKLDEALDMLENVVRDEVDILTDRAAKERLDQMKHISDIKDEIDRVSSDLSMSIKYRQFLKLFIAVKSAKGMISDLGSRLEKFENYEQLMFEFTPNVSILKLLNALETLGTVNSVRSETVQIKLQSKNKLKAANPNIASSITTSETANAIRPDICMPEMLNTQSNEKIIETSSKTERECDVENGGTKQAGELQPGSQITAKIQSPVLSTSLEREKINVHSTDAPDVSQRVCDSKSGIGKYMPSYSDNEDEIDDEKLNETQKIEMEAHDEKETTFVETRLCSYSSKEETYLLEKCSSALNESNEKGEDTNCEVGPLNKSSKCYSNSNQEKIEKDSISMMESDNESEVGPGSSCIPDKETCADVDAGTSAGKRKPSDSKLISNPEKKSIVDENEETKTSGSVTPDVIISPNVEVLDKDKLTTVKPPELNEESNKKDSSNSTEKRSEMYARANLKNPKDRVVVFLKDIAVTSTEDSAVPTICGMAALGDDRIAVCDNENKAIKLVDVLTNIVVQTVKTDQSPWDVCEAGEEKIAVTFPFSKQIGIYKVTESVKKDYLFNVDGGCYGIAYANDNLFVAFGDSNVVKVMDLYGYVLRVLQNMRGEKPIFNTPKHITAGPEGRLFYVSNLGNDSVTCLTALGHVAGIFTDRELKAPRDVAVDSFGLVYVCNFARPCGIQVLTKGLNKVKKLLNKDKAISNPLSLAYSYKGDWLFVGIKGEHLKMYKLTV